MKKRKNKKRKTNDLHRIFAQTHFKNNYKNIVKNILISIRKKNNDVLRIFDV